MTKTKKLLGKSSTTRSRSTSIKYGKSCRQKQVKEEVEKSGPSRKSKSNFVARMGKLTLSPVVTHKKKEGRRGAANAALHFLATEGALPFSSGLPVYAQMSKKSKKAEVDQSTSNGPTRTDQKVQYQHSNPISTFMEYGQRCQQKPILDVVGQSGPSHKPMFTIVARIGQRSFPPVVSHTKREGRKEAAEVALRTLAAEGALQPSPGLAINSQSVLTENIVSVKSKSLKKSVARQGKQKKGSIQTAENQLPEKNVSPNSLEYLQNEKQIDTIDVKLKKGKVQYLSYNPISAFMEYGQSCQQKPVLEVVGQSGPAHKPKFTIVARIGQRVFQEVVSNNKKDGRREAAEMALRVLAAESNSQLTSEKTVVSKSSVPAASKKQKKSENPNMKRRRNRKKGLAQKVVKDQGSANGTLSSNNSLKKSQIGQHSSSIPVSVPKRRKGKGKSKPYNPVSAFIEYGQSCQQKSVVEVVGHESGPAHKPKFTVVARIGQCSFPPIVSENEKDGRREAAEAALRVLAAEGASVVSSNPKPVQSKRLVHVISTKSKKVVTHGLSRKKKKMKIAAHKVKVKLDGRSKLPEGPRLECKESGQHPSGGDVKGMSDTVQVQHGNPISAFMEYGQSCQQKPVLEVVEQSGPAHKPKFTVVARIGQRSFPPVVSGNKKDGRREAAEAALRILVSEGAFQHSSKVSSNFQINQAKSASSLIGHMSKSEQVSGNKKKNSVPKVKDQLPAEPLSPSDGDVQYLQTRRQSSTRKVQYGPIKLLNQNPISAFMEYGQSHQLDPVLELVGKAGTTHEPKFVFIAQMKNRVFPPVVSNNKKDGRREAADAALRILASERAFQLTSVVSSGLSSTSQPSVKVANFHDQIASLSHQTFSNLVVDIPECFSGKKVISALILKMDDMDCGRVIALGTGNRCVTGDKLSLEGQTVQDSHAEVITRRAFMRYLYRQLKMYRTNPEKTILCPGQSGKLTLKEGCSLHLYISTAPCGDGAQFSWTDSQGNQEGPSGDLDFSGYANHCPTIEKNIQGLLRTKMELGEGTIPIQEENPVQTWDAIMQNQQRLRTMSCSDKVCRWNILGLQGSLLTHFVEPIYLSSLTLGTLYHHGHLSRAVCCRLTHCLKSLTGAVGELPPGYRINHPQLGHVTSPEPPRGTEKTKEFSVNWYAGCDNAEVTDGTVGRIKGVLPSRLCKMNLLKEFIEVCTIYDSPILQQELDTYSNIKLTAEEFQKAKAFMKNLFRKGKYGTWVEKPVEVEMFSP